MTTKGTKNFLNTFSEKFGDEILTKNFGFYLYVTFLGILYITNSHHAMKEIKEINSMSLKLKTQRWFYVKAISETMQKTKLSQMKIEVQKLGLREILEPPQVIKVVNINSLDNK